MILRFQESRAALWYPLAARLPRMRNLLAFLLMTLASTPPAQAMSSDRDQIRSALDSHKVAYEEIESGDGSLLIVPAMGARLLGAFIDGANALWVHPRFVDPASFGAGGDRTWLAPEGHQKGFFFSAGGQWRIPPSLDPGHYEAVAPGAAGARAWATIVDATVADGSRYRLQVTREVGPAPNPLAGRAEAARLRFVGAAVSSRLRNLDERTLDREIGIWSIVVGKPDASVVIPVRARGAGDAYRDTYYERPLPGRLVEKAGALVLRAQGPPRTKVGIPPSRCRGIVASLGPVGSGSWQLVVNRFHVEPDGVYVDRPRDLPNANGDAAQVYNAPEAGALSFFEMEAHAPAVVLRPGEEQVQVIEILVFRGRRTSIVAAATRLLDVTVADLPLPEGR
jgi:Family of unknown function (DUF6786)